MFKYFSSKAFLLTIGSVSIWANVACEPVDSGQGEGGEGGEVWGQVGAGSSSSSSGQAGAGGAGGSEMCLHGQTQSCYTGPIGTENIGPCRAGTQTCVGGVWSTCMNEVKPIAEICDYIDNDCDGQVNESSPCSTGKWGVCAIGSTQCMFGTTTCNEVNVPSPEVCDNLDNDCNGFIDDGDPGGMPCPPAQIVCGVFVGPVGVGAPGHPGTQAQPLSTIADAQVIAALDGSDICLCDTPDPGESVFEEDVTMLEGVSIYGGYDCTNWTREINTYVTTIRGGVYFSDGITPATVLGGLTVRGKDYLVPMQQPEFSMAICISNSSPQLIDVKAAGGAADYSLGLGIGTSNGGAAAPIVIGGEYSANGNGYGAFAGHTGISVRNAGGTFVNVTVWADGSGNDSTGFSCSSCSAFISGSAIRGGYSQKYTDGVFVSGNASDLFITNTTINGGSANGGNGYATGIDFSNCTGSPTLNGVTIDGGSSPGFSTGLLARGSSCMPNVTNSTISGGSATFGSTGVHCYDGAACVVTNSIIDGGKGSSQDAVDCYDNGCGVFAGNTIKTNTLSTSSADAVTIRLAKTSPTFENNTIWGPACPNQFSLGARYEITYIQNSAAVFRNNVFLDQPCLAGVYVIRLKAAGPTLHNNTIQFATCNGCGPKYGLFIDGPITSGSVRNNIFFNAGTADFANAFAIAENTASSDLPVFQNNLLWAPNGGTLYWDEGSSALQLPAINILSGSTGNISADPMLDATFHLLSGSPCRNAGTATGAPAFDFDNDPRPQEGAYDIGADEYVP